MTVFVGVCASLAVFICVCSVCVCVCVSLSLFLCFIGDSVCVRENLCVPVYF